MIKHIVMWKLKEHAEGAHKQDNLLKMRDMLLACKNLVPGIISFEVGVASPDLECTYDIVLYSVFADKETLDAYQTHPQHEAIKPFIGAVRESRQCMDYSV